MQDKIRNFSIIAHIDHGKTTLTDQFLHVTNTVGASEKTERIMDSNPIEKERGITIKLAPARMEYKGHILNLIDTPGHVDFGYEVSRSLAACEGGLLVVDATQGIQAQTLSNYEQARALGLTIIPVVNKVDLPSAEVDRVMLEIMELCNCDEDDIIKVSAKTGVNVPAVLDAIIERIPAPTGDEAAPLRGLLITSHYDVHKGAIGLVRVVDGELSKQKLHFLSSGVSFLPVEIGVFSPTMRPVESIQCGEVGYIATGLKDIRSMKIGDTVTSHLTREKITKLAGYKEPTPMVFMELYPTDAAEFTLLQDAMDKLALRDAALTFQGTHSMALGSGLRVGFLGILHAEIVLERLSREFDLEIIATLPSVTYKVTTTDGIESLVQTPGDMPDPAQISFIKEPIAAVSIYAPKERMGDILNLVRERRGEFTKSSQVGQRMNIECEVPLAEIITDFHDVLKSLTSGYASLEYSISEFRKVEAVKVTILLNAEPIDALSFIAVRERAEYEGRKIVAKLKDVLPRQMFEVPIQAAIGGKIIARETLKAFRKDVTAKLYGGDVTRRKKLLSKQAKGKKRMKQFGKVEINQETFMSILKR
ncbi:MAG: elongation factor 4 [Candidatus Pacebacteria bacterium]|nr:elongation factor 4 [Candidatus Paceibacterota bacterium]PIZ79679.1 MAG: elongation factor 4 [Candidatus Pacebacteria bacterium CG_4_10_14_0_2_um_filter_40_20]PJA68323.1 MAG: elongation factor 4 [Candidatus Pacebacteria bacterium CG_4_9_14_3_um_filter_40_12]PJC41185.1 MAG: elongation factor 4 [Candidatus Pacebacteria bacterium CG_4_9_14_0_2_um_filter_40_15]